VYRHGGALNVTSDLGHGSRFDVYLPALDPSANGLPA
jgi:signal transduction histidine kinase